MSFPFERDSLDVPMTGLGRPLTAQRYEIVRARDRRASSKHAVSTNRKSSTLFIGSDKSQTVAISEKNGNPIKDIRDVDLSHQNFDCLSFFRKGKRVVMFNDLGEFRLKL